jgi:hypothetical protein
MAVFEQDGKKLWFDPYDDPYDEENGLASLWRRRRIAKKAHSGRGQESKWEMSN